MRIMIYVKEKIPSTHSSIYQILHPTVLLRNITLKYRNKLCTFYRNHVESILDQSNLSYESKIKLKFKLSTQIEFQQSQKALTFTKTFLSSPLVSCLYLSRSFAVYRSVLIFIVGCIVVHWCNILIDNNNSNTIIDRFLSDL